LFRPVFIVPATFDLFLAESTHSHTKKESIGEKEEKLGSAARATFAIETVFFLLSCFFFLHSVFVLFVELVYVWLAAIVHHFFV